MDNIENNPEELTERINALVVEYEKVKRRIEESQKIKKDIKKVEIPYFYDEEEESTIKVREYSVNEEIKDEIDYYFENILNVKDGNNFTTDIIANMPRKTNRYFEEIIRGIKLRLLAKIKEINGFINEYAGLIDEEDFNDFISEMNSYYQKINCIDMVVNDDNTLNYESQVKNDMFFIDNMAGTPKILAEIMNIEQEHYDEFFELFRSIINGTFKGIKRLRNNDKLSGYSEVRWYKSRIIFDRVGPNDYVPITAFRKKVTIDNGYREKLTTRILSYEQKKDSIIENLNDEEFRKRNEEITEELMRILGKSKSSGGKK